MMLNETRQKHKRQEVKKWRNAFHKAKKEASRSKYDFYMMESFKDGADWALKYIRKNFFR